MDNITLEQMLNLIKSWIDGECPGEVLLDAAIDLGIDIDSPNVNIYKSSIRSHLLDPTCSSYRSTRENCHGAKLLRELVEERILLELNDSMSST